MHANPRGRPAHPPTLSLARHRCSQACTLIEEAYAISPKISTALSAANLRLKLGDYKKAIAAYRKVLSMKGADGGPTEREIEMAERKLWEVHACVGRGMRHAHAYALGMAECKL